MTIINSFLQKKRLREFNYGIYMVIAAYALSILLLIIGSDTFYNITSKANGLTRQSDEVNKTIVSSATDTVQEYHQLEYRLDYRQRYLEKYQKGTKKISEINIKCFG